MSRAGPSCRANISPLLRRRDFRVLGRLHSNPILGRATASLPRLFPILSLPISSPFLPLLKITRQRHLRFDVRFLFIARSQSQVPTTWPLSLTYVCTDFLPARSLFARSAFRSHLCCGSSQIWSGFAKFDQRMHRPRSGLWSLTISPFFLCCSI